MLKDNGADFATAAGQRQMIIFRGCRSITARASIEPSALPREPLLRAGRGDEARDSRFIGIDEEAQIRISPAALYYHYIWLRRAQATPHFTPFAAAAISSPRMLNTFDTFPLAG